MIQPEAFEALASSTNGIIKLRELILELAVRGLLVPQDPNDESASVLLEKIAKEKARLISEGKIKKEKSLSKIDEDEKLFEIPNGWDWVRLGDYGIVFSGNSFKSSDFNNTSGAKVIKITNAGVGDFVETEDYLPASFIDEYKSYIVEKDDLILALTRPYISTGLKISKCPSSYHMSLLNQRVAAIRLGSNVDYAFIYLQSISVLNLYKEKFGNSGLQPNLKVSDVTELLIPIPPLEEQQRIVARVDELMALCDQLEQHQNHSSTVHQRLLQTLLGSLTQAVDNEAFQKIWSQIAAHFDTLFTTEASIDQLKQIILQLAVMGKLVPQDSNDEPASALLEKIAEEKARLVKEGKIKKQNPLPKINKEEKPFQLPIGWEWVRLGRALKKITDGTHHSPPNGEKGEYLYISAKNIKSEGIMLSNATYVTREVHDEIYSRCDPEYGDLLYIKDGATTGIVTINNLKEPFSMLSSVALLKVPKGILNSYLLLSLRSPYFYNEMRAGMTGVAITRVTLNKLDNAIISIPSLAEQHRIVAKVNELMAICDLLKSRISKSQQTQEHLATAIVEKTAA